MSKCLNCDRTLVKEKREISPGIFAQVEVCPKCNEEWVDEKEYEKIRALFKRKAFKVGGSLAVRIPKEIADIVGLGPGADLSIKTKGQKIIIEKTEI